MALAAESSQRRERFTFTERQLRRAAHAALFTLTLIIATGAAVRLTGSGLGCPDWPRCNGGRLLPELGPHHLIEFGNRLVTGVVGVPCVLAAVFAWRLRPFRREYVAPALILPFGVLVEAIIGGITVRTGLHWGIVMAHYLTTCLLLVAAAVLVWRIRRRDAPALANEPATVLAVRGLAVFGGAVLVLGSFATAAGPHAGGAGTGDYVERLTAVALETMIKVHGHAAAVMGGAAVLLYAWARWRGAGPDLLRALAATCVLVAVMGVLGLVQYHNALPSEIVWVHTSLAAVTWLAMVWATLAAGRPQRRA